MCQNSDTISSGSSPPDAPHHQYSSKVVRFMFYSGWCVSEALIWINDHIHLVHHLDQVYVLNKSKIKDAYV